MRNFVLKWLGLALGATIGVALLSLCYVYVASDRIIDGRYPLPASHIHAATDPNAIARGARLVFIYGCADCHGHNLQGAYIEHFGLRSRNLTMLARELSDADFDRIVRRGIRPNGTPVAEFMPSDSYQFMPDADLAALLGYLRVRPAMGASIPEPTYGLVARYQFLTGERKTVLAWFPTQKPAFDTGNQNQRGRLTAMTACGECHTTSLTGQAGPPGSPPDLLIVASYDRSEFLNFMRTGKAAGNRELPMMSAVARMRFSHFNNDELNALYDYLLARGRKLLGRPR